MGAPEKGAHHIGGVLVGVIGVVIGAVVIIGVAMPTIQGFANLQNDTLNFTSARAARPTSGSIGQFVALANTSTTLTQGTDYNVVLTNQSVVLLQTGTTNLANCVAAGGSGNCNYFATYYNTDANSRNIISNIPVFLALTLLVVVASLILGIFGKK